MLTFRVGEEVFALPTRHVREVTRLPRLTRVPHAPASLLGLANLRGSVVPIVSVARMLDRGDGLPTRIIVVEDDEIFGLAVDEASQVFAAGLAGAVRELDVAQLIARAMPARGQRPARRSSAAAPRPSAGDIDTVALVAFTVGYQEFALPLAVVDEVLPLPNDIAPMPHADDAVVGSAVVRDALLPLLSLRALLGFPVCGTKGDVPTRSRLLVIRIGRHRLGLVVDDVRAILQIPAEAIDIVPQVLNRGQAEARIQAICRIDGGERLVSVLAPELLLRQDITARLLQAGPVEDEDGMQAGAATTSEQFLVFRIGGEEFGLPIGSVEEVAPLPHRLTRLPKAPAFIKGVMNLRGRVVPVIDQAHRFGATPSASGRRRVIVVRTGDLYAGFIVDDFFEVVAIDANDLAVAPDLGNEQTRVFERVANLTGESRIILIVSPRDLLDRVERDLLGSLGRKNANAPL